MSKELTIQQFHSDFYILADAGIEEFYRDCDLLTGKNYDNIIYDSCIECYRYDICKKYFDKCKEEKCYVTNK